MAELSWNPSENRHLTEEDVKAYLGVHWDWLKSQENPALTAHLWAMAAFSGDDVKVFAYYRRACELLAQKA